LTLDASANTGEEGLRINVPQDVATTSPSLEIVDN
jgi:hypothetical protein